jgi:cytochrome c oxidase subunit 2
MNGLMRALLDLPPQASTYAASVDLLHYFVITATMLGATFVFLLALYYLVRYRQRVPGETTVELHIGLPAEIFIIGSILTLFLVFWAVGNVQYDHIMTPPDDAMPVYVTAKQWMWKFSYPDGRSSMDVLTVPAHRRIKLVMGSRDVIHSFYVPAFRMKHDVVPGRYYTAWFEATMTGRFPIECAEYCGVSHSRMLGSVEVLSPEDYRRWLETRPSRTVEGVGGANPPGETSLADAGREVAARRGCFGCHTIDGQPHIGPTWAGLYDSVVTLTDGSHVRVDEAYLTRSMMEPQAELVAGFKPVMPTYRGTLEQPEVAALVEFIKSVQHNPPLPSVQLPRVVPQTQGLPREPGR